MTRFHYIIRRSGEAVLSRAHATVGDDPLLGQFLDFLAHDMASHPQRLQLLDSSLALRIHSMVGGMEVNLDAPLSADDE